MPHEAATATTDTIVYQELTPHALTSHRLSRLSYIIETLGFVACCFRPTCGTRMTCESHAAQLVGEQRRFDGSSGHLTMNLDFPRKVQVGEAWSD